ncbi:MAG: tetratricopeptide repeat protein [Neomegalonema sp.]|nr:tetratricopeptide repeat protein [Neomegalonema sp.]
MTRVSRFLAILSMSAALGGVAGTALGDSFTGSYLAGRHAAIAHDMKAAASFFGHAVAQNPEDSALLSQALVYAVSAGEMRRAMALATRLDAREPGFSVSRLVLAVDAIRSGDFDEAALRLTPRLVDHGRYQLSSLTVVDEVLRYPASVARRPIRTGSARYFETLLPSLLAGWAEAGRGDFEAAADALEELSDREYGAYFGGYHAGLVESFAGDHARAVEQFEAAMAANETVARRVVIAYGRALEAAGRAEDAIAQYDAMLARAPRDPQLLAARTRALHASLSGEPRLDVPLVVASPTEGAAEVLFGLGSVFAQEDDLAPLALIYGQLALHLHPGYTEARLLVAEVFENMGRTEDALHHYAMVPQGDINFVGAQVSLAFAQSRLDRMEEAIGTLQALTSYEEQAPTVYFAQGGLLSAEKRYEECIAAYSEGLQRLEGYTERNWWQFFQRGICLERRGEWQRAEGDFQQALELSPGQPDVLNYMGYSLVEMGMRLQEARDMIERAVEAAPERGYIIDSLGWVLYRLGDYEEAVAKLQIAVEKDPVEPVINDHLGDALWKVGRKMEARFQWKRALSFKPEATDELRIRRKLEQGLDAVLAEEAAVAAQKAEAEAHDTVHGADPVEKGDAQGG